MALRPLILYANPVTVSFGATLHSQVVTTLRSRGHQIDDRDLYAESFDPVMGEQGGIRYHDTEVNRAAIAAYVDRLLAAEALVLIYPVWNEGFPAILKGFFDRDFIPAVTLRSAPTARRPKLAVIRAGRSKRGRPDCGRCDEKHNFIARARCRSSAQSAQ